ncbi:MAG: sigma-70 family RNA polymerase sigma factor [Saprospiraceae bacterium]|nr:sigma-70 family RNA polymerase sigma factor [Saprospiraceae bacterium]
MTTLTTSLSPRGTDDYQLVLEAINGNQKAYETLMNRYRHSVYHAMFKMVNNRDDADDLTIEAFGKAFHKLPSYAPNYAFSTWLFRIAINNCIDYIRKKRLKTFSIDETMKADGDSQFSQNISLYEPDPEHMMVHDQKIAHIRRLVEKLSTKYRAMIELRYYEELSYEEIAQEMNLPLGTVKAQLFRAKEILYQQLLASNSRPYLDVRARHDKEDMAEAA